MSNEQIQDHRGTWVRAEVADALQEQVTRLTAEVEQLRTELAAAKEPEIPSQQP